MLLLDIGYPASPATVIADSQQVGAAAVGLYVINQSLPGTVRTPAFIQAVCAGAGVLPIVVPGNNPPGDGYWVVRSLQACGFHSGVVAIDLETGSLPFSSWVTNTVRILRAAGYQPWVYATPTVRRIYPDAEWWEALWDQNPAIYPGTCAHQYGGATINGHQYDKSSVIEGVAFVGGSTQMIKDLPTSDLEFLAQLMIHTLTGHTAAGATQAEAQAQLDGAVSALKNGDANRVIADYSQSQEAKDWATHLRAAGTLVVDTSQLAPIVHEHTVTGVAK